MKGFRLQQFILFVFGLLNFAAVGGMTPAWASDPKSNPSIFIRYQYEVSEIISLLKEAEGKPLDPSSVVARWLDEMGWRKWVKASADVPFRLTTEMKKQLLAQEKFLRSTFSYAEGDVVWVPAEVGEEPYGHKNAKINPRGQIVEIIKGETETYFLVEVGVDNGSQGGMRTIRGTYYNHQTGPVLDYGPDYTIQKKTYVYSLSEMERYNAPFRSDKVGSDTGVKVDYIKDLKWLEKISEFRNKVVDAGLEIDFTKSPEEIYAAQNKLVLEMFRHFKMDRNAPAGRPLLGDVANGGGACFTQACVLSHGTHAVGEPYGIRALNIEGATVNPSGGHGFVRLSIRGPEETHIYDIVKDSKTGDVRFKGLAIKSNTIHVISDPGWGDFGKTEDQFAKTPIESAINPIPIDANRAIHDILEGKSFEEVVEKYGNKGPMVGDYPTLKSHLFKGSKQKEFLSPTKQIAEKAILERALSSELSTLLDETKALKQNILTESNGNVRTVKTRILTEIVNPRALKLQVPGLSASGLRILLTEYLFRAVK